MKHPQIKVLVAPLDWGLGHATRCIPVIRELLLQQAEVIIAASGNGFQLLKNTFPDSTFIDIPGIRIHYPAKGSMTLSIVIQLPAIFKAIRKEKEMLSSMIDSHGITHVVSDNRYGLYDNRVKSAFISHQVSIKNPGLLKFTEPLLYRMHKKRIENFHELWIPDFQGSENLAGSLTETPGLTIPKKYTGILSRFNHSIQKADKKYESIALLSGPEPQRSLLEKKLKDYFLTLAEKCLIIQGIPGIPSRNLINNVEIINAITDTELQQWLHPDTTLFCRPGYSTLMDLAILGHRKNVFIPTPGQTEQEYLADRLKNLYSYTIVNQNDPVPDAVQPGKQLPDNHRKNLISSIISDFLR